MKSEIEEKRQRVDLLKKRRLELRQQQQQHQQQQSKRTAADITKDLSSILGISPQQNSTSTSPAPPVTPPPLSSSSSSNVVQTQQQSSTASQSESQTIKVSTVQKRSFTIDLNLAIVDIPPKEITTYTRSTQTFIGGDDDDDNEMSRESEEKLISSIIQQSSSASTSTATSTGNEEGREIGESIDISADLAALNKKEAAEKEKQNNNDKSNSGDKSSMMMNKDEANSIMNSFNFIQFFNKTSRCLERAVSINERYPDISKDYLADSSVYGVTSSLSSSSSSAAAAAARYKQALVLNEVLADDKVARTRSVTCLDWSPENPELLLAGFSASSGSAAAANASYGDSDGVVMVWSVPSALRKSEYTFTCQVKKIFFAHNDFIFKVWLIIFAHNDYLFLKCG